MTVAELIKLLQKEDPEAEVYVFQPDAEFQTNVKALIHTKDGKDVLVFYGEKHD